MKKYLLFLAACIGFCSAPAGALDLNTSVKTSATAWTLIDGASGTVLGQHNQDSKVSPGELVQLMTFVTALDMLEATPERMSEAVTVRPQDVNRTQSLRRLYLAPGSQIPLETLLHGIAVVGAEDAALAVSRHLSGSPEAFAKEMNATAEKLGMKNSRFTMPIAVQGQITTAFDLSLAARHVQRHWPKYFAWFSEKEFNYAEHSQRNCNLLLWKNDKVSGVMSSLKGTDLIASWKRPVGESVLPRDVLAVLLNGSTQDKTQNDALTLLRIGRMDFETLRLFNANTPIVNVDVVQGNREKVTLGSAADIWVTLNRPTLKARGTGGFSTSFIYSAPLVAPIKAGSELGVLRVEFEGKHVSDFPLIALHDVGQGSFFIRFVDSVRMRLNPQNKNTSLTQDIKK